MMNLSFLYLHYSMSLFKLKNQFPLLSIVLHLHYSMSLFKLKLIEGTIVNIQFTLQYVSI